MKFYGHPRCSTVKKAQSFLAKAGIEVEYIDLTTSPPRVEELREYHRLSGLDIKKFFNTSGMQYRELKVKERLETMSLEDKYTLLAGNGMLIKRPLLVGRDFVLLGFKEEDYKVCLGVQ